MNRPSMRPSGNGRENRKKPIKEKVKSKNNDKINESKRLKPKRVKVNNSIREKPRIKKKDNFDVSILFRPIKPNNRRVIRKQPEKIKVQSDKKIKEKRNISELIIPNIRSSNKIKVDKRKINEK